MSRFVPPSITLILVLVYVSLTSATSAVKTSCLSLSATSDACEGEYTATGEIHNGKDVYVSGDGSFLLFYHVTPDRRNHWYCGPKSLNKNGVFLESCDFSDIEDCDSRTLRALVIENCVKYIRDDGKCGSSSTAPGTLAQPGLCDPTSNSPCCKGNSGTCGSSGSKCDCSTCIDYRRVTGDCFLEDIVKPVSFCGSNALDEVDHELALQMVWNVAGVVLGEVPVVGTVFDLTFAVLDPVGPTTSRYSLVDNLRTQVEDKMHMLEECMNEELSNLAAEMIGITFSAAILQADTTSMLEEPDYTINMDDLWMKLYPVITAVFSRVEDDYVRYSSMLPVYQAIVPLWMATTTAYLSLKKEQGIGCNFNTYLWNAKNGTNAMLGWIDRARDSIVTQMTPDTSWDRWEAQRSTDSKSYLEYYHSESTKHLMRGRNYFDRGVDCDDYSQDHDLWVTMTRDTNKVCHIKFKGSFHCGRYRTDGTVYSNYRTMAKYFTNALRARLSREYAPDFNERYKKNLNKFSESLAIVPKMICDDDDERIRHVGREFVVNDAAQQEISTLSHNSIDIRWQFPVEESIVVTTIALSLVVVAVYRNKLGVLVKIVKKRSFSNYF